MGLHRPPLPTPTHKPGLVYGAEGGSQRSPAHGWEGTLRPRGRARSFEVTLVVSTGRAEGGGQRHTYPVLVIDDLHQAAMLRFDGRWRHRLLGLGRLSSLLLQLLLWEGGECGGKDAGRRKEQRQHPHGEGRPRAARAGGRAQEVRLLTISSESPSGTPSPGEAPALPARKSPAQDQLQPPGLCSRPYWGQSHLGDLAARHKQAA